MEAPKKKKAETGGEGADRRGGVDVDREHHGLKLRALEDVGIRKKKCRK